MKRIPSVSSVCVCKYMYTESNAAVITELRITKDTELGDNDSIKNTKNINRKKKTKHTGGCCGGNH